MSWIEHLPKTRKLILAWEAPTSVKNRTRWAIGELVEQENSNFAFRYYMDKEFEALNQGRSRSDLPAAGYLGYPAFSSTNSGAWITGEVVDTFKRRLLRSDRPDYGSYLSHFRIPALATPSTMTLLGLTQARLPSDGFSLVDPLDAEWSQCDLILEAAGFRHYKSELPTCEPGSPVNLVADPMAGEDPHAVKMQIQGKTLGYVNRLQSTAVHAWLESRVISTHLLRINGSTERPRPYLFVSIREIERSKAA